MSVNPFANEDVMEDYMSALLTDEHIVDDVQRQSVDQLLKTAPVARTGSPSLPAKSMPLCMEGRPLNGSLRIP